MICLIDNYDSFTYNVVAYLHQLGHPPVVYKNDQITIEALEQLPIDAFILSPGPGTPQDSGITLELIRQFAGRIPILGICLGHECIAEVYGASIVHAERVMHGKTSLIDHDGMGVFSGVPNPIKVARYHSLIVDDATLPDCLAVSASYTTAHGKREIMGIRHKLYDVEGVQFHPESILTDYGHLMLANFLRRCFC
ncbi:aminodeoxychorismate/anthranilate synthase component II [Wohlfahrtiimonas chitiniclastica]|nr:aminodeoxychorismate/anthranilate synthase component II [Wohlfahrtiimonas chitiniclastica]KZS23490.1 glutamine amidotransferase [Wohlfahrtiimonas chitiniclastica]MBS7821348.1 aminodeoxychorismate/anthranilate synthase component II [Wohlfahrtiimonas chitiniclastica]MDC7252618.1 glutamine amidotransferase [Wohlfahrtiimonas chitiniclastica]WHR55891.1 aminodeoxychorismate/anthranilate synthase component II [Wohlfahrtiimonas chitiniclastica]